MADASSTKELISVVGALGAALLAGLFALGGSYVGTRFALGQHKAQKAHDLRLDWYLRTIRALTEKITLYAEVTAARESGELTDEYWDEWVKRSDPVRESVEVLFGERRVFGTPHTIRLLNELTREGNRIAGAGMQMSLQSFPEYLEHLIDGQIALSLEARRQVFSAKDSELHADVAAKLPHPLSPKARA